MKKVWIFITLSLAFFNLAQAETSSSTTPPLSVPTHAESADLVHSISPSVALDFYFPINSEDSIDNRLYLRSAEVMMDANLAAKMQAHFNFAFHDHQGEMESDVHEAYLKLHDLVPNLSLKLGKFLLGVGILNRTHQHDWNFSLTPKVQQTFFAEEGVSDNGLEFTYTLPTSLGWELALGATDGYKYGHSHETGERPRTPTLYGKISNYLDVGAEGILQTGINYLYRNADQNNKFSLTGLDLQWQDSREENPQHLVSSEIWYRQNSPASHSTEHTHDHSDPEHEHGENESHYNSGNQVGLYVYLQSKFQEKHAAGFRADYFKYFDAHNSDETEADISIYALVPSYVYFVNENSKIRLSYAFTQTNNSDLGNSSTQSLILQWVAILGGHSH